MKRKIPQVCLVLAIVLASTFLPATSGADPRETPRAALRAGTDWLGSAFAWLNSLLETGDRERNGVSHITAKEDESSVSGVCIDPMGRPRPCPEE